MVYDLEAVRVLYNENTTDLTDVAVKIQKSLLKDSI